MSHFERSMAISPQAHAGYALELIRPPAALMGANGIRIGPDARLWICEAFAQRVAACDTKTGELTTVIPRDGSLVAPDDLAFDSAGTLYITDSHRVTCRRADGSMFTLTDQLIGANGITIDNEDRLYVDELRPVGRLMEIDRSSGAIRTIVENLGFPNACAKGRDGRIYLQNVVAGIVFAIDVRSGEVEQIAAGFQIVSSVKFDSSGRLVLSEAMSGVVTAIELETGKREQIARMPLGGVDNIEFDREGALYISSYTTGSILKVPKGDKSGGKLLVPPGLMRVSGIAACSDGSFLVANLVSAVEVQADGAFADWCTWTPAFPQDFVLDIRPIGEDEALLLTEGGQVYRCPRGALSHTVKAAAQDGTRGGDVLIVGEGASAIGSADDGILIAFDGGEVRRFEPDGALTLAAATGQKHIAAIHQRGRILATADPESGTVGLVRDGVVTVLENFARPTGVALDMKAEAVFVAEHQARRVVRCHLASGAREVVATDLPFGWPQPEPPPIGRASLLMQEDGVLVIACDGDGSIRRLIRR